MKNEKSKEKRKKKKEKRKRKRKRKKKIIDRRNNIIYYNVVHTYRTHQYLLGKCCKAPWARLQKTCLPLIEYILLIVDWQEL